jgi:hypothetical protein
MATTNRRKLVVAMDRDQGVSLLSSRCNKLTREVVHLIGVSEDRLVELIVLVRWVPPAACQRRRPVS